MTALLVQRTNVTDWLRGHKTETRRLKKLGEYLELRLSPAGIAAQTICHPSGRVKWQVGRTRAIKQERTGGGVGRIVIERLWSEDVRSIGDESVVAEGFTSRVEFLRAWTAMHDTFAYGLVEMSGREWGSWIFEILAGRPDYFYRAWGLKFRPAPIQLHLSETFYEH